MLEELTANKLIVTCSGVDPHSEAFRAAHLAPLMDACDAMGVLVITETRRMASDTAAMAELGSLVRRDRNRPSVIAWSIGNEEQAIQGTERGARIATTMVRLVNRLDPTRPTTAALDQGFGDGVSRVVDILGFNYRMDEMSAALGHSQFLRLPSFLEKRAAVAQQAGAGPRPDPEAEDGRNALRYLGHGVTPGPAD